MRLTPSEKNCLRVMLQKELKHWKRERKTLIDLPISFLKGGHDYKHFIEGLIKKLK